MSSHNYNLLSPTFTITFILLLFFSISLIYSCGSGDEESRGSGALIPQDHDFEFVGDKTCQSCHTTEWEAWQKSHHDYAMKEPTDEMVRAHFDNETFTDSEGTYRFFRENGKFLVETPGSEGEPEVYEVVYTFGWEPLQQYLLDYGSGKLQALHIAWDTEQELWFSLYPNEELTHGDWLHWTGQAMNWNVMCAECHSTNLKQNYISEADSFNTTYDVINVSCESCHGPGGDHVEFMETEEAATANIERIREDLNLNANVSQIEEINTCAMCHSRREKLTEEYVHGAEFLDHYDPELPHSDEYFADGQILGENYEYGSFLQSKMYMNHVQCSDCHDPHTLRLKESITDNKLCMQCHVPSYNTPEHHFHEQNTEASQCVNCHMTGRVYMGNDFRRDHSFRVPRPDISKEFDTPNACNDCHEDQSVDWAAQAVEEWYGDDRKSLNSEIMAKASVEGGLTPAEFEKWITDSSQPELIRATLVWYAGQFPSEENMNIIVQALESDEPLIRTSAVKAMENLPADLQHEMLSRALEDSIRVVRLSAFRGLTEFSGSDLEPARQDHFNEVLEEYKAYLVVNEYFPQGQMNQGLFFEQQGETDKAIEAYHAALDKDPSFNPARINLAYLYNTRGNNPMAEELLKTVIEQEPEFGYAYYSLGLLKAEENQLQDAINYFEQAAELMPEHHRLFYNLAIAYQTAEQRDEAETAYKQAIELQPENGDYIYGLITLYMQQENYEEALEQANKLDQLNPGNPQIQQLIQMIRQRMN